MKNIKKGWVITSDIEECFLIEGVFDNYDLAKTAWADCIEYYLYKYPENSDLKLFDAEPEEEHTRIWYTNSSNETIICDLCFSPIVINIGIFNPEFKNEFKKL